MSDFLYSSKLKPEGELSSIILDIYNNYATEVQEFHGKWGSLAVSTNVYKGFKPYETESHICIIIGGPVLNFRDNGFLTKKDSTEATKAIYERCLNKETIKWDEDLNGPFAHLLINKKKRIAKIVTDLLSSIPVFQSKNSENIILGTHIDTVAKASGNEKDYDIVSIGDFILSGAITYPHSIYNHIRQLQPGTIKTFHRNEVYNREIYWLPDEEMMFNDVKGAAEALRTSLINYIECVTRSTKKVASFISGGEDSRTVLASLSDRLDIDAYVFLDRMNKEGEIARKAAEIYSDQFYWKKRNPFYYLDILTEATDLVGSSFEYAHAHSYGFIKSENLNKYSAVFGGLLSDALLKGNQIQTKRPVRLPLVPEVPSRKNDVKLKSEYSFLKTEIVEQINKRRKSHFFKVKEFRPISFYEWGNIWPITSDRDIANFHCNRRLFRTYEPFMSNRIIKISSSIPQKWKINRRVFQKMASPLLKKSKWLRQSNDTFPYFPWYMNEVANIFKKVKELFPNNSYEGPWTDWDKLFQHEETKKYANKYSEGFDNIEELFKVKTLDDLLNIKAIDGRHKRAVVQVSYFLSKIEK